MISMLQLLTVSLLLFAITVHAGLIVQQSGTIIIPIPIPDTYSIQLSTPSQNIISHPVTDQETWISNSQVISSITKIQLKGKTSFQFTYILSKQNATLIYKFEGSNLSNIDWLSIDYLLFTNGTSKMMNMTDFQWHLDWQRPDALLMFLNGFSEFQLSGNISYLYIAPSSMYTIHYMGSHNINGSWGDSFLLYSILLISYNPIQSCSQCKPIQKIKMMDKMLIQSPQNNIEYFFGLKGYNGNKFRGQFYYLGNLHSTGVEFEFDKEFSEFGNGKYYALTAVPFEISDGYQDLRMHKIRPNEHQFVLIIICLIVVVIILWCIGFGLYQKYCHEGVQRVIIKKQPQFDQLHQQQSVATKVNQDIQQNQNIENQKQQQMKEQFSKKSQNQQEQRQYYEKYNKQNN